MNKSKVVGSDEYFESPFDKEEGEKKRVLKIDCHNKVQLQSTDGPIQNIKNRLYIAETRLYDLGNKSRDQKAIDKLEQKFLKL